MNKITAVMIAALASSVAFGATAFAADMPVKASPSVVGFDWTGGYLGFNAGIGAVQTHNLTLGAAAGTDRTGNGFVGGLQAGYNWQFDPHWVGGIEVDFSESGIDRSHVDFQEASLVFGTKADWFGTVRGRFGYTSGPSFFYATGGAAFVDVKNTYSAAVGAASRSETATGWTAGGGIETILGNNWSAKAEVLYIDAGSQNVFNPALPFTTSRFSNDFYVFREGLNYKFGGPSAPAGLPQYNWNGFYAGVNAGGVLAQSNVVLISPAQHGSQDIADGAFTGGLQVGYNWTFAPRWIAGLEGDINWLGVDREGVGFVAGDKFGMEADWFATARGRLGFSTGPALIYATGGAAFVHAINHLDFGVGVVTPGSNSETATGWTVGGGIEAALGNNWSAKTEYLYVDAGSQNVTNSDTVHFENRFQIFRFGLNYKFGG